MAGSRADGADSVGWEGDEPPDTGRRRGRPVVPRGRSALLAVGVAAAVVAALVVADAQLPRPDGTPTAAAMTASAGSGDPEPAPDPDVTCMGSQGFRPVVLTRLHRDLAAGDAADRALLTAIRTGDGFGGAHPFTATGWFRIVDAPDVAEWLHERSPGRVDARVTFHRDATGWQYVGSGVGGPCVPSLAQYAGDDNALQSAEAMGSTLLLVVDHGTCGPDLAPTDVLETARTVTLTVHSLTATADPAPDGTSCGGVEQSLTIPVGLRAPLGTRTVLDGRYFPPRPVPLH